MLIWQLIGELVVLSLIMLVFHKFVSQFKTKINTFIPLFAVLVLFTVGFGLRLSKQENLIDFGFFFTEISYLFTYVIFTSCLILGQKKYWKIS